MRLILSLFLSFLCLAAINIPTNDFEESKARGKEIYEEYCITCHMAEGEGVEGVFPPLANSDYLIKNPLKSIYAIKYGQQGEIVVNGITYNSFMSELGLDDQEVADVMNYVRNAWGNQNDTIITAEIVKSLEE